MLPWLETKRDLYCVNSVHYFVHFLEHVGRSDWARAGFWCDHWAWSPDIGVWFGDQLVEDRWEVGGKQTQEGKLVVSGR